MRTIQGVAAWVLAAALVAGAGQAAAAQLAGVQLPERLRVADGADLVLNGAGIRRKFFFKIYVGALYVPHKLTDPAALLAEDGPRAVLMHFVYGKVGPDRLAAAWREGFEDNTDREEFAALGERLARFSALFPTLREGDELQLVLRADGRTDVRLNGALRGSVPGRDFQRALLKVFVGEHPADADLKRGMLGGG